MQYDSRFEKGHADMKKGPREKREMTAKGGCVFAIGCGWIVG